MQPKLNCPHCGYPAMSGLKKSFLGPARSVACQSCGQRVSVPYLSMLWAIPMLAGMVIFLPAITDFPVKIAFIGAMGVIGSLIYVYLVPLEAR